MLNTATGLNQTCKSHRGGGATDKRGQIPNHSKQLRGIHSTQETTAAPRILLSAPGFQLSLDWGLICISISRLVPQFPCFFLLAFALLLVLWVLGDGRQAPPGRLLAAGGLAG